MIVSKFINMDDLNPSLIMIIDIVAIIHISIFVLVCFYFINDAIKSPLDLFV
jgi:hypothetical protein